MTGCACQKSGDDGGKRHEKGMRPIIYFKADRHVTVTSPQVTAEDLGEVYCKDKNIEKKGKAGHTLCVQPVRRRKAAERLGALGYCKAGKSAWYRGGYTQCGRNGVCNEPDISKEKGRMKIGKIIGVAAVTFVGSIFAIMTYNEDVSVLQVFEKISEAAGQGSGGVRILACGYAAGIAAGIILFF